MTSPIKEATKTRNRHAEPSLFETSTRNDAIVMKCCTAIWMRFSFMNRRSLSFNNKSQRTQRAVRNNNRKTVTTVRMKSLENSETNEWNPSRNCAIPLKTTPTTTDPNHFQRHPPGRKHPNSKGPLRRIVNHPAAPPTIDRLSSQPVCA